MIGFGGFGADCGHADFGLVGARVGYLGWVL